LWVQQGRAVPQFIWSGLVVTGIFPIAAMDAAIV